MRIAYYDEAGDDGFPAFSSSFFVLSAIYLHYLKWRECFEAVQDFRRTLRGSYRLPFNLEFHAKYFLLNKNPYRQLGMPDQDRLQIVDLLCDLIASLDVRIVNVVIVKPRIRIPGYSVLDKALTYSIQRIENDLEPDRNPAERFLLITDTGRVGKMRKTARRVQRINFIPSRRGATSYRREIRSLIEDPLPKDSRESHFIQLADLVAQVVYLHSVFGTGIGAVHGRMPQAVTQGRVGEWMDKLRPRLNVRASGRDPYGVFYHPYE